MIAFILSPALTFFSKRLYKEALQKGAGRGLLYLGYLTLLFCFLATFLFNLLIFPLVQHFTSWLVQVTPEMTMTATGLKTDVTKPYRAVNPSFGPLYVIDTSKRGVDVLAENANFMIAVGYDEVLMRDVRAEGAPQRVPFNELMAKLSETKQSIRITKEVMKKLMSQIEGLLLPIALLIAAPFFFTWKLFTALFYSLIALLLNLFRKERFQYRNLFAVSCYAVTPVTVIQFARLSLPEIFFLNALIAIALTCAYLLFAIFVASKRVKAPVART
jgi:hypothetical protein